MGPRESSAAFPATHCDGHVMSDNLFIGFKPYHVFLAVGLSDQFGESQNSITVVGDSRGAEITADTLLRSDASPFRHVEYHAGPTASQSLASRVLNLHKQRRRIESHVRRNQFSRVVVFHEHRPESQAAIYWSKRSFPETLAFSAEDGWNAYVENAYGFNRHPFAKAARRLAYGSWWEDVATAGEYSFTDGLFTVVPKAVQGQRTCPVHEIRREFFASEQMRVLASEVLTASGFDARDLSDIDAVVFLARSTIVQKLQDYPAQVVQAIDLLRRRGMRVAIKYHPREPKQNPYGLDGLNGVVELPQGLAAEFLLVNSATRVRVVLGDITTSLMTAKWLFPEMSVLCFNAVLETLNPELAGVFSDAGVLLVDDLESALSKS